MINRFAFRKFSSLVPNRDSSNLPGKFGLKDLDTPEDWLKLSRRAVGRCKEIIEDLTCTPPSVKTIKLLDDISDTVCQVHDAAEFCWNVHTDPAWRHAAQQTCINLGGYVQELNHNKALHSSLVQSLEHYERLSSHRQASSSGGSPVDDISKSSAIEGYTSEAVLVGKLLVKDFEKAGIHLPQQQRLEAAELTARISQCGIAIRANIARIDQQLVSHPRSFLFHTDEQARKQGYRLLMRTPEDNKRLLDLLASDRQQLASMLASDSYSDYVLDEATLAGRPQAVSSFLANLNESLQPQLKKELKLLKVAKSTLPEASNSSSLNIWDRDICYQRAKAKEGAAIPDSANAYFYIRSVLHGLKTILKQTFDVDMAEINVIPGESWAPEVIKLSFSQVDEGPLGELYIDPLARADKLQGSAHFTLRCKKRLSNGDVQQPIAALAFDFSSMMMTPGEAKTFFHEFGHALHTILSRAEFQHLAGTRGPMDMVEIPSHFFEHFLQDSRCLKLCARHYSTCDAISQSMQAALQRHWNFMPALDMNDQVVNAMVDQSFHSKQKEGQDPSSAISQTIEQFSAFHPPRSPGLCPHLRFAHLVTYGASYYAYPYAKFIAAAIWRQHFAADPFCRDAGILLRDRLLGLGGAKPPKVLVEDLLGIGSLQNIDGGWAPTIV